MQMIIPVLSKDTCYGLMDRPNCNWKESIEMIWHSHINFVAYIFAIYYCTRTYMLISVCSIKGYKQEKEEEEDRGGEAEYSQIFKPTKQRVELSKKS